MTENYTEFEGTEFDPTADMDFEEDQSDLVAILGLSAIVAAIVGAVLVLIGRRRTPTRAERAQQALEEAVKAGRKQARTMGKAVREAKLGDMLEQAIDRAREATARVDVGEVVSEAQKRARKIAADGALADILEDALHRVKEATERVDVGEAAKQARRRAERVAATVQKAEVDTKGLERFASLFAEKLAEALESVREDIAPKAVEPLKSRIIPAAQEAVQAAARAMREEVVPTAQEAAERMREEVIPAAQERAAKLAEQYEVGPRTRKAAETAVGGAVSLGALLKSVGVAVAQRLVENVLPELKKTGAKVATTAREEVIPAAADTAGEAAKRVRKDVLPKVTGAAARTPEVLSDTLQEALDRVERAFERAQPMVEKVEKVGKKKAGAVGGRIEGARRGVTGTVGSAVDATTYVTRETTGILLWLSVLGSIILLVFVPDKERQKEILNNILQFFSELREMWRDLQGIDYDYEAEAPVSQTEEAPTV
jgi:hypothetical protein